jgi:hypothetical protein
MSSLYRKLNRKALIVGVAATVATVAGCTATGNAADGSTSHGSAARTNSVRADSIVRARQDSINHASPGYVIDSVLPVEEELRRFRAAIGGTEVAELQHASRSRTELVRRFVRDLALRDSADLKQAAINPREFADLIYPNSPNTLPPYRQSPGFVWMQINGQSSSGLTRVLQRRGGSGLTYLGHTCPSQPDVQGANRLWTQCTIRLVSAAGDTTTQRLFGTIVERAGRFKFVSYANQF